MKTPKFTDKEKHPTPYRSAQESRSPGYLARRFRELKKRTVTATTTPPPPPPPAAEEPKHVADVTPLASRRRS